MMTNESAVAVGFVAHGQLNRVLGWALVMSGMLVAALLDPWTFERATTIDFASGIKPMVRHAQGVVLGMALLQLAMGRLLAAAVFSATARRASALLTAGGAIIYAAGYALALQWPSVSWLVLPGSLMNLVGLAYLMCVQPAGASASKIRAMLPIAVFGMLLDFTAGILFVFPDLTMLEYLGPHDGIRLRMMRLARVAVIALSAITLLYQGLVIRSSSRPLATRGGWTLMFGAIGMPLILAAACFTSIHFKYLLVVPATAVSMGVFVGLWLAVHHAGRLERAGWTLIAVSISFGLLVGLYAFDGPLPTPEFFGGYNELARRLARLKRFSD